MSTVDPPPSPGVPRLPETSFDASLSLSLDQIIGDSAFGDVDIDPEYVAEAFLDELPVTDRLICTALLLRFTSVRCSVSSL